MKRLLKNIFLAIILLSIINSCEINKEPYENPEWLGGSIFETLEKNGNYTNLIRLAEIAEYRDIIESDVYTFFAADDDYHSGNVRPHWDGFRHGFGRNDKEILLQEAFNFCCYSFGCCQHD